MGAPESLTPKATWSLTWQPLSSSAVLGRGLYETVSDRCLFWAVEDEGVRVCARARMCVDILHK